MKIIFKIPDQFKYTIQTKAKSNEQQSNIQNNGNNKY